MTITHLCASGFSNVIEHCDMNEDVTTFNAPANTSGGRSLWPAETFLALGRIMFLCVREVGVVLCGCFLLILLFSLQVAALEVSDRLNIFPLFGFFSINLFCGLFLTWLIVKSRNSSSLSNRDLIRAASVKPRLLRRLWAGISGVLSINRTNAQTRTTVKPVAVLLIIKRQARVESKQKSHAASA
jgi:hypothetical protein